MAKGFEMTNKFAMTVLLLMTVPVVSRGSMVTFDGLVVGRSNPFVPYTEDGFLVTPSGQWWELTDDSPSPGVYGNPSPSIWVETYNSSLDVTNLNGQLFTFAGVDFWNWSPESPTAGYTFEGFLGGASVFSTSGAVPSAEWFTAESPSSSAIDRLLISLVRGKAEQIYVDNIAVRVVPEPASIIVWLGVIALGATAYWWRRRVISEGIGQIASRVG